jgi:hypothetical protein
MNGKGFAAGLLAVVGVLAWTGTSRGGDTIRLGGVDKTPTKTLVDDGRGADTIPTWYRGGWGGWGWGGYRGLGWGGWGYRGLGWGGLGWGYPGWGWGGYRGLGWGGLYRPFGFGLGYGLGWGGFYPGFGLGYGGLFWPCAGVQANVYTLNGRPPMAGAALPGAPQTGNAAPAPQPGNEGTFPYDGGPAKPTPTPKDTPPSTTPRSVPLEGLSVSLPKAAPKWRYPAYGETARRTTSSSEPTYLTRGGDKNSR